MLDAKSVLSLDHHSRKSALIPSSFYSVKFKKLWPFSKALQRLRKNFKIIKYANFLARKYFL